MEPPGSGDLRVSRKLVPVGTTVRVSASILIADEADAFATDYWAMEGVFVSILYTDGDGDQPLLSRAEIRQYTTQGPFVEKIAVLHQGEETPFVEGRACIVLTAVSHKNRSCRRRYSTGRRPAVVGILSTPR